MNEFPIAVKKSLEYLGLNKKQVEVLSHLYAFGKLKANTMSQEIKGITRPEVYNILSRLVKLNLIESIQVNNVSYFELKKDADLIRWANKARIKAQEKYEMSKNSVGQIKYFLTSKFRNIEPRPLFNYFEGSKGLESIYKTVIQKFEKVDIYLHYSVLSQYYTKCEKLISRIGGDNPGREIRIILIDKITNTIPEELRNNTRLFFRSNPKLSKGKLFSCIGDKWLVNFSAQNGVLRGIHMHCQNYDCVAMLKEGFEQDWERAEEIK